MEGGEVEEANHFNPPSNHPSQPLLPIPGKEGKGSATIKRTRAPPYPKLKTHVEV